MRIVIQCAAKKQPCAGSFTLPDNRSVLFVAHPDKAPYDTEQVFACPDDISDNGKTWRERLLAYNKDSAANFMNFLPAYELYANKTYGKLVEKFGIKNIFILSAGWGLISADFLTPLYYITFSTSAEKYKRRRKKELYQDFCMIPDNGEDIIFLGGKDYLPMFCTLTSGFKGKKTVIYNSINLPDCSTEFTLNKYETTTRTNWHYECANILMDGKLF